MAVLVTIRWSTPPPSAIDERLVVLDDGQARLEVVRPRVVRHVIGTFAGPVEPDEVAALTALGPEVGLGLTLDDPAVAALGAVASAVADRVRENPLATATFGAQPYGEPPPGNVLLALTVMGGGTETIELELDPAASAVHFGAAGSPVSWQPLPHLPMGFMTPDAEGLGGVRRRAAIAPDVRAAISVEVPRPAGADEVSAQLAGRLHLPDSSTFDTFEVRTVPVRLSPPGGAC